MRDFVNLVAIERKTIFDSNKTSLIQVGQILLLDWIFGNSDRIIIGNFTNMLINKQKRGYCYRYNFLISKCLGVTD